MNSASVPQHSEFTLNGQRLLLVARDWLLTLLPSLIALLLGATVFRDAVVNSIRSTPHPGLVYAIMSAMLIGVLLTGMALHSTIREGNLLLEWQAIDKQQRHDSLMRRLQASLIAPILQILDSHLPLNTAERQSRLEYEVRNLSDALANRLLLPNYLAGALVGMGLVGTFIGLLGALDDLSKLFSALMNTGKSDTDPTAIFADMLRQLQEPMRGMGTAFVASLYGLLGSLILGLNSVTVSKVCMRLVDAIETLIRNRQHPALSPLLMNAQNATDAETAVQLYRMHIEQLQTVFERLTHQRNHENTELAHWQQDLQAMHNAQNTRFTNLLEQLDQEKSWHNSSFKEFFKKITEVYTQQSEQLDAVFEKLLIRHEHDLQATISGQMEMYAACLDYFKQQEGFLTQLQQERLEDRQHVQENARQLETLVLINQDLAHGLVTLGQTLQTQNASLQKLPDYLQNLEKLLSSYLTQHRTLTLTVNPVQSLNSE